MNTEIKARSQKSEVRSQRQEKILHLASCILLLASCLLLFTSIVFASEDFRKRKPQAKESFTADEDIKAEIVFGRELSARILGRYQLYDDKKLTLYINLVGKGVAQYAGRPEIEFRFAVLDTDIINAFAAPGGYIFITKGALKIMEDEAELSAVLAHEIAHVTERHIVQELNIKGTEDSPAAGLARILGGGTETMRVVFTQMVDKAVEILFEKGLKKQDELNSDRIATITAANAGYDPAALKRYFEKISNREEKTEILTGTHPSFGERIDNIDSFLTKNQLSDKKQPFLKERFNENVKIR